MNLDELSLEDLKKGYTAENGVYTCVSCGEVFQTGEIYPIKGHFWDALRAIEWHIKCEHPDYLQQLVNQSSKYNTLTENQRSLLEAFAKGISDKDIAKQFDISPSTVRQQKFIFREKAKQAKLYLAIYESVFSDERKGEESIMQIHDSAKMIDDRYVITEEEKQHILQTAFSSLEPLRLKALSPKEKKKVVILSKIAEQFDAGKQYTEKEINQVLSSIHEDYVTLRRYLIEYGFLGRLKDGSKYWLL